MQKQTRREFITKTVVLSIAGMVLPAFSGKNRHKPLLRFGLVTDSHYAIRPPENNRYYQQTLAKMKECINVFNDENLDFVVHLGDFKDQGVSPITTETLGFLTSLENEYAKFKGPRYHAIGNHDVDSITKTQFIGIVENTGIYSSLGYYSFDTSDYHFMVLDANYDSNGVDHFYLEGANWQDTNIPYFQLDWLKKDLRATNKPTIIFIHHPLFEYFRGDSKFHVTNYAEVQKILEDSGKVVAVFQGHVHEERTEQINNIHYLTHLGMVDFSGLENNSFSIVDIYPDKLVVKGYKRSSDFKLDREI